MELRGLDFLKWMDKFSTEKVAEREGKEEWHQAQLSSPSGNSNSNSAICSIGGLGEWMECKREGHHNLPAHSTHKMCWPTAVGENCRNKFPQLANSGCGNGPQNGMEKREGK